MSEEKAENDLSMWFSTYGLITAERILEKYKIRLQQEDLLSAIKNPNTFYHRLMRVPLKNVLNGIILQQAHDYQVYAQKLFIDYLLSGETGKSEESPGGFTREELENERQNLMKMGEEFRQQELAQDKLIAESQACLIKLSEEWQKNLLNAAKKINTSLKSYGINKDEKIIIQAINSLLIMQDFSKEHALSLKGESWGRVEKIFEQSLSDDLRQIIVEQITKLGAFMAETDSSLRDFIHQIAEMSDSLRKFRSDFYNFILRVTDLIKLLPEYHYDPVQTQENRESLYFDTKIGEET